MSDDAVLDQLSPNTNDSTRTPQVEADDVASSSPTRKITIKTAATATSRIHYNLAGITLSFSQQISETRLRTYVKYICENFLVNRCVYILGLFSG